MHVPLLLLAAVTLITLPSTSTTDRSPEHLAVRVPAGHPVDEEYRRQFGSCDRDGSFRGYQVDPCTDDPNQVTALRRLHDGAIAYVSKLAVDLDGSRFACGPRHGRTDQCPTALMLRTEKNREIPVDADAIPYVVIPEAGPPAVAGEFTRLTRVKVGDFGIVIANGRVVPVIVGDTGPFAKLGEGSLALHRALGRQLCVERDSTGECSRVVDNMESIGGGVRTVLFPGTARRDLTPRNIASIVHEEGLALWARLNRSTTDYQHG